MSNETPFVLPQGNFSSYNTLADATASIHFKTEGMEIYIVSEDKFYYWNNNAWVQQTVTAPAWTPSFNDLVVSKTPKTGEYSSIEAALTAIGTMPSPTISNGYTIHVGVGEFLENKLTMPPYVSVIGTSIMGTVIKPIGDNDVFYFNDIMSEISFLSIQNVPTGRAAINCDDAGEYNQLHKVNFVNCDTCIKVFSKTKNTLLYAEYCDCNGTMTYGAYVEATNGFNSTFNTENWYVFPNAKGCIGVFMTGVGAKTFGMTFGIYGNEAPGSFAISGNYGIVIQDGGHGEFEAGTIGSCNVAVWNPNIGESIAIDLNAINLEDNTMEIILEHKNAAGAFMGSSNISKVIIPDTATFTLCSTQPHGRGGLVITGPIYSGDLLSGLCDVTSMIYNNGAGLISGGDITVNGTFEIAVGAGVGYFYNAGVLVKGTWDVTLIDLAADQTFYICVDVNGVSSYKSKPSNFATILLGTVRTNSTDIDFISTNYCKLAQVNIYFEEMIRDIFGPLYEFGSVVTRNSTPFTLDITGGEYYFGTRKFIPSGGELVMLQQYRADGKGGYIVEQSPIIPNTSYDGMNGTLKLLENGTFTKHSLYLVGEGANEKYLLVYGQASFVSENEAVGGVLPTPPPFFSDGVVLIASIIVGKDSPSISRVTSERPFPITSPSSISSTTTHSSLLGLTTGNAGHTQFLMLDGTTPMTGDLNLNTGNISNIGTLNGISLTDLLSKTAQAFGGNISIGLSDSYSLGIKTNNIDRISISATGVITLSNLADLTTRVIGVTNSGVLTATVTTTNLTEGTNLYFTDRRVRATLLDGFVSGAGTITTTDSILSAINKLDGNITGKQTSSTNLTSIAGLADKTGWLYNDGAGVFSYSAPTKSTVGLSNVEDTALSTWVGTIGITTVGTIKTGVWHGNVIDVAYGGTGFVTTTAYGILTGGTTATGSFQNIGTGTLGQMLISNGAAALPTWASATTYQVSPTNPTGTTSTTGVMMGLAGTFTPTRTGTVIIVLSADAVNGTAVRGVTMQLRTGTGTAPTNGAAVTGTTRGNVASMTQSVATVRIPLTVHATITGLTLNTAVWIDVSIFGTGGAGTSTISNVSISVIEI